MGCVLDLVSEPSWVGALDCWRGRGPARGGSGGRRARPPARTVRPVWFGFRALSEKGRRLGKAPAGDQRAVPGRRTSTEEREVLAALPSELVSSHPLDAGQKPAVSPGAAITGPEPLLSL